MAKASVSSAPVCNAPQPHPSRSPFPPANCTALYIYLHADSATSAQAVGNKWHFFLSHTQQNGDAKTLASTFFYEMKDRGYKCWLDVQMPKQDMDAMQEGVENSEIVLAIITGGDDTKMRCTPICGSNHRLAE